MSDNIHVEKFAIYLAKAKINEREIRNYVIERWADITKGMKNATILFMAGVHGTEKGTSSKKAGSFQNIINQVC